MQQQPNRSFVSIEHQQSKLDIHYRTCGDKSNTAIFLLHPSPLSSAFMVPLLKAFGQSHFAIAWDAPGYGDSSKLAQANGMLDNYIDCLAKFMDNLNIDKGIIYGNATGAQIAIEFAKKYPDKTVKLVLENVAVFHDDERASMLEQYFPDLTPCADGQHLQHTWKMVNNLFTYFPWYDESDSAKLTTPFPPLEVLQTTFVDYVKAGVNYADAYIAAINNERPEQLIQVAKPTEIVLWQDSIIFRFCQRLLTIDLPDNIQIHQVASGMETRVSKLLSIITEGEINAE
ncbi:alpha/beta fold hydrolase [Thalassotalea piscium]